MNYEVVCHSERSEESTRSDFLFAARGRDA